MYAEEVAVRVSVKDAFAIVLIFAKLLYQNTYRDRDYSMKNATAVEVCNTPKKHFVGLNFVGIPTKQEKAR